MVRVALTRARSAAEAARRSRPPRPTPPLEAFLDAPIPTDAKSADDRAAAYTAYTKSLSDLDAALDAVIPVKRGPTDPLPDATEVTSVVDRKIVIDRWSTSLDQDQLNQRVALAKIRLQFGCADAVVIVAPLIGSAAKTPIAERPGGHGTAASPPATPPPLPPLN